ncbi:MAG: hypothetical protein AAF989_01475 [Planctomycetota bacterium]
MPLSFHRKSFTIGVLIVAGLASWVDAQSPQNGGGASLMRPDVGAVPGGRGTVQPDGSATPGARQIGIPRSPGSKIFVPGPDDRGLAGAQVGRLPDAGRESAAIESLGEHPNALSFPADPASQQRQAALDPHHRVGTEGGFIGFSHVDGRGTQVITLVDTRKLAMSVYHIDQSGLIRLQSSRPIDADFSLLLNGTKPLPEEIRQLQRQSRSGPSR